MKYLKPYRLFESQEVLLAGLENAVRNNNLQLIKDMVEQHNLDPSMDNNKAMKMAVELENQEMLNYLATFPSVQKVEGASKMDIVSHINFIKRMKKEADDIQEHEIIAPESEDGFDFDVWDLWLDDGITKKLKTIENINNIVKRNGGSIHTQYVKPNEEWKYRHQNGYDFIFKGFNVDYANVLLLGSSIASIGGFRGSVSKIPYTLETMWTLEDVEAILEEYIKKKATS